MEEKIQSCDVPIEFNPHIAKRLKDMDQTRRNSLAMNVQKIYAEYTHQSMQYFDSLPTNDAQGLSSRFWSDVWLKARDSLFDGATSEDDRMDAASVLYELAETNRIQDSGRLVSSNHSSVHIQIASSFGFTETVVL